MEINTMVKAASAVSMEVRPLSPLDRATAGMVVKGVWYFRQRLDGEQLRRGLASVLERRPWLAGRLTAQGIACGAGDGVPFVERALPGLEAAEELARGDALDRLAGRLSPAAFRRGSAVPLAVSLVQLDEGSLLYVQGAHACMDGCSFYALMDEWGRLCRGEAVTDPVETTCLLTDPDFADDPAAQAHAEAYGWPRVGMGLLVRMVWGSLRGVARCRYRLRLTEEQEAGLVGRVNAAGATRYGRHVVLSALLAAAGVRLSSVPVGKPCTHVSVVNLRRRMAGVPERFDGNAVYNVASQPFSSADPVEAVAERIDRSLHDLFAGGGNRLTEVMRCYLTVVRKKLPYVPFDVAGMYARRSPVSYVNDFLGFPIYDVDFGRGRPALVLPPDLPDAVRLWPLPPEQGGGVEVIFAGWPAVWWKRCADPVGLLETLSEGKERSGR